MIKFIAAQKMLTLTVIRCATMEDGKVQESSASLQEAAVVKAKDGEIVSKHEESHFQEDTKEVVLQQPNCPLVTQEEVKEEKKEEVVLEQANCPLVTIEQKVEESKQVAELEPEKEKETSSSSSSSSDEQEKRSLAEVETEMTENKDEADHTKSVSEEKKEDGEDVDDLLPPPPQEDFPPPPAEMMSSVEDLPPPVFDLPSPSEEILPPPVVPEFEDKTEELEDDQDDSNIKSSDKKVETPPRSSYVSLVSPTGFAPSFPKSDSDKVIEASGR